MITKEYLALRAGRMLVRKHMNKEHGSYVMFDGDENYELPWNEVYEILTKMIDEKEKDND